MMSNPIILITAGRQNHDTPRREMQTVTVGCDIDYLQSVLRSGGTPLLLPCLADSAAIHAALQVADGVIISGGGDILSLLYGEEPHPLSKLHDPTRDTMEIEMTREALAMGLPVLGICRGQQLLNIALGGTLVQDIPSQVPDAVKHFADGLDVVLLHSVDIVENSLLSRVLGATTLAVNSWHHQAVRDLGNGLRASAVARDGVVEAIEATEGTPLLAVQWHPEECAAAYPIFQRLFDWLVSEALAYRAHAQRES